jgi:hypothetical protein
MNLQEAVHSEKKDVAEAAQYIELLASQTSTPIQTWDIKKVFCNSDGDLISDKSEINKRFFTTLDEMKSKTFTKTSSLEKKITQKIDSFTKRVNEGREATRLKRIAALKKSQEALIQRSTRLQTKAYGYIAKASEIERKLLVLERKPTTLGGQIGEILRENFWRFQSLKENTLGLVTQSDVILSYRNAAKGINLRANMGTYVVKIDLERNQITVRRHKGGISVSGYCHPHIGSGGNVCWGSAYGTVDQLLPKGKIADVLRLLSAVLTNYNDGNPYIHLEQFVEALEQRRKK